MKDFFISYTRVDEPWAVWIAWALEEAGYSVVVQAWDFRPGSNFVLSMQKAAQDAQKLIAVLSPAYLKSGFCGAEWAAFLAQDPTGLERKLLPVRIEDCEPPGLLRPIVYIDLVGLDEESGRTKLLSGLVPTRMKPNRPPSFPGAARSRVAPNHPAFPAAGAPTSPAPYIPRLRPKVSDLDVRRFMQASFLEIRQHFASGLEQLKRSDSRIDTELREVHDSKIIAEVYVDGALRCSAKVWLGTFLGRGSQIGYAEGRGFDIDTDNRYNEILTARTDEHELRLKALMSGAAALGSTSVGHLDLESMRSGEAAEYLWRRFVAWLER
jgi:hypothetical protein